MSKTAKTSGFIRPGCIVEFMQGGQPQLAWTLEEQKGKLRLLTLTKREVKMSESRLMPWIGPEHPADSSRQVILDTLAEHQSNRGEIQAGLDLMEIWELAQGEMEAAPIEWFAGLLWENPSPDQTAALGRAMLTAKTHFKFRAPDFEIYPQDKVEARISQAEEEKERELVVQAGQTLFKELWEARKNGRPPVEPPLEDEVRQGLVDLLFSVIAKSGNEKNDKIWAVVQKGLPDHPHLALLLAQTWGVAEAHHNHLLDEAGYAWTDEWSLEYSDELKGISTEFENLASEPEETAFVSIDGPSTRDIDDAFHIRSADNGGYLLTIALARPDLCWNFDSPLDKAVLNRATSLYLPEGTSHMLPETLGTDMFSLLRKQPRPALVTEFHLDKEGGLLSVAPRTSWVMVEKNETFEGAEQAIEQGADQELTLAHELSEKLLAVRLENGAAIINRPEPTPELTGQGEDVKVSIVEKPPQPKAEQLISEFMILANSGLALFARDNDVPLLHRTQDIALPAEANGVFSEPPEINRVVRLLAPAILEATPKRHAAIGVPAYSPISSPLRRYPDLINLSQITSFLEKGSPRLNKEELENMVPLLSARIQTVSQIQRYRPRYWKLLYLLQNRKTPMSGVVVEPEGAYPTLALPELQINVRLRREQLGDKIFAGQRFQLRFGRIDPLTNDIRISEALEE